MHATRITLLLFCGLACAAARAHDVPPSVAMLDIGRSSIDAELKLQLNELGSAMQLPLEASPDTLITEYGARIEAYLKEHLLMHDRDGREYAVRIESLGVTHTNNPAWVSNQWLDAHLKLRAPEGASTEVFSLDYTVILHRVMSHQALIYVRRDVRNNLLGDKPQLIGVMGFGRLHVDVDGSAGTWRRGFTRLFTLGMQHIAQGSDHVLFLLALLLPAPLLAVGRRWRTPQSVAGSIKTIVRVVSGFTLGHSLSLALAAGGWVTLPTGLIEVLIAVSILVSSLHAWRPLFAGREVLIAVGFGLIHGLAFAETLAGLNFDRFTLALSLAGFNLGIETMQLLLVAAILPLLIAVSGTRSYSLLRLSGAALAGLLASGWIAERAWHLANPFKAWADWLAAPPGWLLSCVCAASGASMLLLLEDWFARRGLSRRRAAHSLHAG